MTTMEKQPVQIKPHDSHVNDVGITLVLFSIDERLWVRPLADGGCTLPEISIPKWTRVAQEVARAAATTLALDVFCLWEIHEGDDCYMVGRVEDAGRVEAGLVGIEIQELIGKIENKRALRIAIKAQEDAFRCAGSLPNAPFKRIDWDITLQQQLQPMLKQRGMALLGRPQQLNASETFALLRIGTTGVPLWFKAVGEPNLAEYSVTLGIHELFPGTLPPIIARFPDWHGWVTEDTGGKRLDSSVELREWTLATTRLAEIQIASLTHIDELFQLGCTDCRAPSLLSHLDIFVEAMRRAMGADLELQTQRLDLCQIEEVADSIRMAVREIESLRVPDALVHRDLSGGNLQIVPDDCYFIDWAQAAIGHPFICSEYMKVHLAVALKGQPDCDSKVASLSEAYASRWSKVLTPEQIEGSLKHAPLLAEYVYVLPMDGRTSLDLLGTPEHRAMMRSMVRRMWRELHSTSAVRLSTSEVGHA